MSDENVKTLFSLIDYHELGNIDMSKIIKVFLDHYPLTFEKNEYKSIYLKAGGVPVTMKYGDRIKEPLVWNIIKHNEENLKDPQYAQTLLNSIWFTEKELKKKVKDKLLPGFTTQDLYNKLRGSEDHQNVIFNVNGSTAELLEIKQENGKIIIELKTL